MASLQIGRLFSDYTVDPVKCEWQGDRLSLAGVVDIGTADQARAVREQVNAMNDNKDEPFVALQWSQDSAVNGFYKVLGTATDPGMLHLSHGYLGWGVDLQRVSGSQYAPLESVCSWQLRTNNRSVTSGTFSGVAVPQFGIPGTAFEIGPTSGTVSGQQSTLSASTSIATGFGSIITTTGVTVPANGIMGWSVDPTNYYYGACTVTTDVGSATDQLVFGRRADATTNWMVSNGMVRFFVENVNQTVSVEWWDSAAWVAVNATNFRFQSGGTTLGYQTMTVLRNSPECVVVRLAHNVSSTKLRVYVDLFILRGSSTVYGYMSTAPTSSTWPTSATMGVQTTASVASTAITGGLRATSADGNGNQYILVTGAPACTDTTGTGRTVTSASTNSLSFGISAFGPTGTAGTAQAQAYEFFAQRAEVTRVVAR